MNDDYRRDYNAAEPVFVIGALFGGIRRTGEGVLSPRLNNRSSYLPSPLLRACAKITWQNARSGSDQCSIPNAQFLSEQREAARLQRF